MVNQKILRSSPKIAQCLCICLLNLFATTTASTVPLGYYPDLGHLSELDFSSSISPGTVLISSHRSPNASPQIKSIDFSTILKEATSYEVTDQASKKAISVGPFSGENSSKNYWAIANSTAEIGQLVSFSGNLKAESLYELEFSSCPEGNACSPLSFGKVVENSNQQLILVNDDTLGYTANETLFLLNVKNNPPTLIGAVPLEFDTAGLNLAYDAEYIYCIVASQGPTKFLQISLTDQSKIAYTVESDLAPYPHGFHGQGSTLVNLNNGSLAFIGQYEGVSEDSNLLMLCSATFTKSGTTYNVKIRTSWMLPEGEVSPTIASCNDQFLLFSEDTLRMFDSNLKQVWGKQFSSSWASLSITKVSCSSTTILILFSSNIAAQLNLNGTSPASSQTWITISPLSQPPTSNLWTNSASGTTPQAPKTTTQLSLKPSTLTTTTTPKPPTTPQFSTISGSPLTQNGSIASIPLSVATGSAQGYYTEDFSVPTDKFLAGEFTVNWDDFDCTVNSGVYVVALEIKGTALTVVGGKKLTTFSKVGPFILQVTSQLWPAFKGRFEIGAYVESMGKFGTWSSVVYSEVLYSPYGSQPVRLVAMEFGQSRNLRFVTASSSHFYLGSLDGNGENLDIGFTPSSYESSFVINPFSTSKGIHVSQNTLTTYSSFGISSYGSEIVLPIPCPSPRFSPNFMYCFQDSSLVQVDWRQNTVTSQNLFQPSARIIDMTAPGNDEIFILSPSNSNYLTLTKFGGLGFMSDSTQFRLNRQNWAGVMMEGAGNGVWIVAPLAEGSCGLKDLCVMLYHANWQVANPLSYAVLALDTVKQIPYYTSATDGLTVSGVSMAPVPGDDQEMYVAYGQTLMLVTRYGTQFDTVWVREIRFKDSVYCTIAGIKAVSGSIALGLNCLADGNIPTVMISLLNSLGESAPSDFIYTVSLDISSIAYNTSFADGISKQSVGYTFPAETSGLTRSMSKNSRTYSAGGSTSVEGSAPSGTLQITQKCAKQKPAEKFQISIDDFDPSLKNCLLWAQNLPDHVEVDIYGADSSLTFSVSYLQETTDVSIKMVCSRLWTFPATITFEIPSSGDEKSGLSKGAIAGIVIGSVAFSAIVGFLVYRKLRANKQTTESAPRAESLNPIQ